MSPEDKIRRADEAYKIVENPVFSEAFKQFTDHIGRLRGEISPRDAEGAMKLILMEQTVNKAKYLLESWVKEGDRAQKEMDAEVLSAATRMKRRFRAVV